MSATYPFFNAVEQAKEPLYSGAKDWLPLLRQNPVWRWNRCILSSSLQHYDPGPIDAAQRSNESLSAFRGTLTGRRGCLAHLIIDGRNMAVAKGAFKQGRGGFSRSKVPRPTALPPKDVGRSSEGSQMVALGRQGYGAGSRQSDARPSQEFRGLQQPKGPAKPAWGGIKAGAPPPAHQPAETSAPEPSSNEPNILSSVAQDGAANGIAKNQTQKVEARRDSLQEAISETQTASPQSQDRHRQRKREGPSQNRRSRADVEGSWKRSEPLPPPQQHSSASEDLDDRSQESSGTQQPALQAGASTDQPAAHSAGAQQTDPSARKATDQAVPSRKLPNEAVMAASKSKPPQETPTLAGSAATERQQPAPAVLPAASAWSKPSAKVMQPLSSPPANQRAAKSGRRPGTLSADVLTTQRPQAQASQQQQRQGRPLPATLSAAAATQTSQLGPTGKGLDSGQLGSAPSTSSHGGASVSAAAGPDGSGTLQPKDPQKDDLEDRLADSQAAAVDSTAQTAAQERSGCATPSVSHGLEAREGGHNSAAEAVTSRAEPQLSAWQSNQTSRGSQPVLLRFGEVDLPSDALDLGSPVGRTFHAGPNSSAPFRIDHQVPLEPQQQRMRGMDTLRAGQPGTSSQHSQSGLTGSAPLPSAVNWPAHTVQPAWGQFQAMPSATQQSSTTPEPLQGTSHPQMMVFPQPQADGSEAVRPGPKKLPNAPANSVSASGSLQTSAAADRAVPMQQPPSSLSNEATTTSQYAERTDGTDKRAGPLQTPEQPSKSSLQQQISALGELSNQSELQPPSSSRQERRAKEPPDPTKSLPATFQVADQPISRAEAQSAASDGKKPSDLNPLEAAQQPSEQRKGSAPEARGDEVSDAPETRAQGLKSAGTTSPMTPSVAIEASRPPTSPSESPLSQRTVSESTKAPNEEAEQKLPAILKQTEADLAKQSAALESRSGKQPTQVAQQPGKPEPASKSVHLNEPQLLSQDQKKTGNTGSASSAWGASEGPKKSFAQVLASSAGPLPGRRPVAQPKRSAASSSNVPPKAQSGAGALQQPAARDRAVAAAPASVPPIRVKAPDQAAVTPETGAEALHLPNGLAHTPSTGGKGTSLSLSKSPLAGRNVPSPAAAPADGEATKASAKSANAVSSPHSSHGPAASEAAPMQVNLTEHPATEAVQRGGSGTASDPTLSTPAVFAVASTKPPERAEFPVRSLSPDVSGVLQELLQDGWGSALDSGLRLQPRGLVNTGNLCFMNSILQALLASSPFCALLRMLQAVRPALTVREVPVLSAFSALAAEFQTSDASHPSSPKGSPASSPKTAPKGGRAGPSPPTKQPSQQALAVLGGKPLLPDMLYPTVNRFNPRNVPVNPALAHPGTMAERLKGKRGSHREQEDAQEFLGFLLDRAHEELCRLKAAYAAQLDLQVANGAAVAEDDADGGWVKQKRGNRKAVTRETGLKGSSSLVQDLCGGQYVSQVKAAGAPQSDTMQPFTLLTLDILPDAVKSISDAISRFTEVNVLEDYKLQKDGPEVQATQRVLFHSLPRLLIMHLSRFAFNLATGNGKVHKRVHFDAELRMKASWLARECPQRRAAPVYELIAVVTHLGVNAQSGHYTAAAKQPNGSWLAFDDATVTVCPLTKVLEEPAYLLFYRLK